MSADFPGRSAMIAEENHARRMQDLWLANGGRERLDWLGAQFARAARHFRPLPLRTFHTPAGTPYRSVKPLFDDHA